ncbi:hypothetical protein [Lutimonas vermicola]|uniref:DUF5666 domain-containing protein n=1 Tax=Lutimonas vermicola TaxID=414288 RepID=A0ABU9KZP0_9FLAO
MKATKIYAIVLLVMTSLTFSAYAQDKRPSREKWNEVSMQGTVTEIDAETREITLMGNDGGLMTVIAGEEVERFDEIAVDDVIKFDYYTYLKAEFRDPTPEEVAEPVQIMAEAGKAPEGIDPAAVVGAVVKAVVTIEALNRPFMVATVSGPNGNYVSIPMEDEKLMTELHIGEVLILTYAEAMVVELEKVGVEE